MQKLGTLWTVIIAAVVVAAIIIVAVIYGMGGQPAGITDQNNNTSGPGANVTATSPVQNPAVQYPPTTLPQQAGPTMTPPPAPAPAPAVHFVTPVATDEWKITTSNLISWNKAPGATGYLSLIDATTKKSMGVILNQVGLNQTSYTWNTRDLLTTRNGSIKITVLPGTYMVQITFDGTRYPAAVSPAFKITN